MSIGTPNCVGMAISRVVPWEVGASPTVEQMFEILANRRRRFTLHYLLQRRCPVDLGDVANQVAAWENGIGVNTVSYDQRRNVHTALRQTHIPHMERVGIVDYDKRDTTVRLTEDAERLDIYLDIVTRGKTIPWSEFYVGLGVLFSTFVGFHWVGLVPFTLVPALGWAAIFSFLVTIIGVVHIHISRKSRLGNDGPPPEIALSGQDDDLT